MPEVTMIPASITRTSAKASTGVQRRRVAAYARVSTDSEEQLTSYEAQVDHYTKYIQSREDWIFVGIYTDEYASYPAQSHDLAFPPKNQFVCRRSSRRLALKDSVWALSVGVPSLKNTSWIFQS